MVKLISFDAWNTILKLDLMTKGIARILGELVGLSGESVLRKMISVYEELKPKWMLGLIDDSMILEEAQRALARRLHVEKSTVSEAIESAFDGADPLELVYHDAWGALEDLSRDFKLAVVSNVFYWPGRSTRTIIERAGLSRFFEVQLYADEVGISKPDRRIFLKLCSMLGVSSGEVAHVGDEIMDDVGGAISSGMKAILIRRSAEKFMVIRELGLAVIPRLTDMRRALSELQGNAET